MPILYHQNDPTALAMIYNNVILTVKNAEDVPTIQDLLTQQGKLSRAEPGCERFEVYHSKADPQIFILVERWASQEALDLHRTAPAYTDIYKPKVLPLADRVGHPCDCVL